MFRFLLSVTGLVVITCAATATTISDNLSNMVGSTEFVGGNTWDAAQFATDGAQYTLSSITLLLSVETPGNARLDLYTDSGSQPGMLVGTLLSPGGFSATLAPTVFGGGNLELNANSLYWAALSAPSGGFEWAWTASNSGAGVGFRHTWGATDDAGVTWYKADLEPLMMSVSALPGAGVPEPGSFALLALLGLPGLAILRHSTKRPEA